MANLSLLPGFGSRYTSEVISDSVGADVIDTARCAQFAVQVEALGGAPTITIEHSFDGVNWAALDTVPSVVGSIKRFNHASGPYGLIRLHPQGATSAQLIVVGFSLGWSS